MERTLVIIKPDAVKRNLIGEILRRFEEAGLRVAALRMLRLSKQQAQGFYVVHKERPFYDSLCSFMSEGPVVAAVLEAQGAIEKVRALMGATDPEKAQAGTIRAAFGTSIERNAVHGSDSPASAAFEIPYFFSALEIMETP
jgi:nucleoside-diphosphate kinase